MKLKPHNTAISRTGPSAPLEHLLDRKYFLSRKHHTVFDYGCGRGGDFRWLLDRGYKAFAYDPHWRADNKPGPEESFDIVLCTYVLNVVSEPEEREAIIKDAWSYVAPGGFLMLSVRSTDDIKGCSAGWKKYKDGFISSAELKTFQKGFYAVELEKLVCKSIQDVLYVESGSSGFVYILASRAGSLEESPWRGDSTQTKKRRKR